MSWPMGAVENARKGRSHCEGCPAQGERSQRVHPGYFNFENADIMFVGTEPTHNPKWEERDSMEEYNEISGEWWVGNPGRDGDIVNRIVEPVTGINIRDTWVGDALKCPPRSDEVSEPRREAFRHCRHYLKEEISLVAPSVLITLGNQASTKTLQVLDAGHTQVQSTIECGRIIDTEPPVIISTHYDRNYLISKPKTSWRRGWADDCSYLDRPYSSNLEIVQDALDHVYN